MTPVASELWGVSEIARELGVSVTTVTFWRRNPTFPEPLQRLAAGPIWAAADVRAWRQRQIRERRKRRAF